MHRREVLKLFGAGAIAGDRWTLGRSLHDRLDAGQQAGRALTVEQMALVTALADTILPKTDSPGAVEVGTPAFIDLLVAEWYSDADKAELLSGLAAFDDRCRQAKGNGFAALEQGARDDFLRTIDGQSGPKGSVEATYRRLKDAVVFGYLTSKPVATMIAWTPIIPGRFDGCVPVGPQ